MVTQSHISSVSTTQVQFSERNSAKNNLFLKCVSVFFQETRKAGVKKIYYDSQDDDDDNESGSSIPSLNEDKSRKGSEDENLNPSQQPMITRSAMSQITGKNIIS